MQKTKSVDISAYHIYPLPSLQDNKQFLQIYKSIKSSYLLQRRQLLMRVTGLNTENKKTAYLTVIVIT